MEFGVGLTVVNALSDYFKMVAYREVEKTKHILEFSEGVLVKDEIKPNKSGKHGTVIEFRVSKKYMGEEAELPIEDVISWVESLFYLNSDNLKNKGITCKLNIYDAMTIEKTYKFKPKPFSDLINKIIPASIKKKDFSELCVLKGDTTFIENAKTLVTNEDGTTSVEMEDVEKHIHLDVAFCYCTRSDISDVAQYDTYCNYTNTIDNGVHLDAFDEAYCRYIQNKVNESMSDAQRNKMKVTWEDIRTNLYCVINLSSDAQVGFVGNAKTKIDNKELIPYIKEITTTCLDEYFGINPNSLTDIIKLVKLNVKARLEAAKAKSATQVERLNTFKEHEMSNYIRPNATGKQWKEIFLVEGNSASGSARNGSDPSTQGFFLFRGVTANAMKCSLSEIMENREWRDLVTVLKCGIGPKFDLNKLYFDRINIFTDSDIDGANISGGMLAFFYKYLRPIIEAGKLYKVYSPLYALDDKEHPFVANKSEMVELYHEKIVKNYKIKLGGSSSYMSKNDFFEFLLDTYDYRENLIQASKESGNVNKFLVEAIIAYLTMFNKVRSEDDFDDIEKTFNDQKFIKTIMSKIQSRFKEIVVDNSGRFSGVVDGKYAIIKVSPRFYRKTSELIPVYKKYGITIEVKEKEKEPVKMTIGEFLDNCMKLTPKIKTRFKGLGELNGDQLYQTTLDINNRISVQYTVDDVERELAIFDLTHGGSKKDGIARKEMMKKYKIKREDLDN